jgi:hypothetical protein
VSAYSHLETNPTCELCLHAQEHGWWGDSKLTHCKNCGATWNMDSKVMHCVSCHETFSTPNNCDKHQNFLSGSANCLNPINVGLESTPSKYGVPVWHLPDSSSRPGASLGGSDETDDSTLRRGR